MTGLAASIVLRCGVVWLIKHRSSPQVYNFCSEAGRCYEPAVFEGRVERYPFTDHGVPPLQSLIDAINSAKAWLDLHPQNVVAFHCKVSSRAVDSFMPFPPPSFLLLHNGGWALLPLGCC